MPMPTMSKKAFRVMTPLALQDEMPGADGGVSSWIQVARTGEWAHDVYGRFSLTKDDFANMLKVFESSANREIMVDYNHASFSWDPHHAKAAGWARELEVRGDGLWARVAWTPHAADMIRKH